METSRTAKVIKNSKFALYYKTSEIVLSFLLRTIFIKTLSTVYLGINGVFTNILTVLSLMDLGVGAAISFSLYKPLAEEDNEKIASLMILYRKIYNSIGAVVCIVGFSLTPFLDFFLTLPENIPEIHLIYWLNIGNTAVSYFLAYKRTILFADQKAYIIYKNDIIFKISRFVLLSTILVFTHNFVLYLALDIFNNILSNIFISYKVNKLYPYLKKNEAKLLECDEKQNLLSYMKAGVLNKIGQTMINSTDNIIISAFVSTITVGYYSNYVLIISGIETVTYLIFSNITSSVANLAACSSGSLENVKRVFKRLQLLSHIISTISIAGLFSLINPFIELWVGRECLLDQSTVLIVAINSYINMSLNGVFNFVSAKGELFYKNRARPLVEAISNLVVSITLVVFTDLGINAVFIGTTISFIFGRFWMDAKVLYKYWFNESFALYIRYYLKSVAISAFVVVVCFAITKLVLSHFSLNLFLWILLGVFVVLVSLGIILFFYRKNEDMIYFCNLIKKLLHMR